jgi:transposase
VPLAGLGTIAPRKEVTDSQFAAKAADIVGLYLAPPETALVLSVDEKPSIQALSRPTGYVQTASGKIVRGLKSTYRRNGTLNLFAALNVATGEVRNKTTTTKKRADFQAFMDEVVRDAPADQEVHVILDNYATHKKNHDWLKAHPNVTFHFTPTSASWLNQIEIWFGILTRKALKGASFNSIHDLAKAIQDFCDAWRQNAHPFVWRKREVKGAQLRNSGYHNDCTSVVSANKTNPAFVIALIEVLGCANNQDSDKILPGRKKSRI